MMDAPLSPSMQRAADLFAHQFEAQGLPRIGARILALLLLSSRPLHLDDIARALRVSRASVSTNTRVFLHLGLIEPAEVRGDRRRHFRLAEHAWENRLVAMAAVGGAFARGCAAARAVPDIPAAVAERLSIVEEVAAFLQEQSVELMVRWQARLAARGGAA